MYDGPVVAALLLALSLAGCTQKTCACDDSGTPDGPQVDFTKQKPAVEAFAAATVSGNVTSEFGDEREGVHFEACVLAGRTFTLSLETDDPTSCQNDGTNDGGDTHTGMVADCISAVDATFPLTGTLATGESVEPVVGWVNLESWQAGLTMSLSLDFPDSGFPHQTIDLKPTADSLDDPAFKAMSWSRRWSADDDDLTVWEMCQFTSGEG